MTALLTLYAWLVAAPDGEDETVTFDLWWLLLVLAIILLLILIWRYFPRRR